MPAILKAGNHFTVPTASNPHPPLPPVDWASVRGIRPRAKSPKVTVSFAVSKRKTNAFIAMRCVYSAFRLRPIDGPMMATILDAVCDVWSVSRLEILSLRRHKRMAFPRQAFCLLAHEFTSRSYAEIGRFIRRDHSTVMHSVKVAKARSNIEFTALLEKARERLSSLDPVNNPVDNSVKQTVIPGNGAQTVDLTARPNGNAQV